jgi:hypothetical protein
MDAFGSRDRQDKESIGQINGTVYSFREQSAQISHWQQPTINQRDKYQPLYLDPVTSCGMHMLQLSRLRLEYVTQAIHDYLEYSTAWPLVDLVAGRRSILLVEKKLKALHHPIVR